MIETIAFGRDHGVEISVRGGGHNVFGNALVDDGVVIDLTPMKSLHLEPEGRTYRAEAELTLGSGLGWLVRK